MVTLRKSELNSRRCRLNTKRATKFQQSNISLFRLKKLYGAKSKNNNDKEKSLYYIITQAGFINKINKQLTSVKKLNSFK